MSTAAATTKIASPYPGLRPFEPHEAEIFFGRGEQIDRMLSRLEEHRFLAVVGASGCGKSSLVRAGLLPALQQGFLEGGSTHWRFVIMRPAGAPFTQLAQAFHNALEASPPLPEDVAFTEATLRRSPRGLVDTITESAHQAGTHYLLLVDQFEEIFRFRYRKESDQSTDAGRTVYDERNEATAFVNLLLATAKQTEFPVYVVITMRSDFTGDCDAFRGLPEAINESQFLAPRLTREQLQDAIIGPLQVFQSEAEPELVSAILNDVGNDPDQLPLMQHALMRTWLQAQKRTAGAGQERLVLKREDYLAIGGLKEALSRHADQTYAELHTQEKQRVAEIMFRCLADEGPQKQVVRRIATVGEIAQVADTDLQTVIEVAKIFLQPDRSFLKTERTEEVRADSTLDVSHEALLRHWGRVQTWLEQEAEAKHTFLRLAETAHLWESGQADVLRPPELDVALQWEARQKPNTAWAKRYEGDLPLCLKFLRASQRASTRRKWVIRGSILAAFMVVSLLTLLFYSFWNEAKTQKENAIQHAQQALELSAKSQHEEGKAWLERALLYQGQRDFFAVSMMAARAFGFDGYGRKSQSEGFSKEFPVLLKPHHPEYQEVQELFRRTSSTFQPIWQSPITSHHQAGIISVAFSPDGQTLASGSGTRPSSCGRWRPGGNGPPSAAMGGVSVWPSVPMGRPWPREWGQDHQAVGGGLCRQLSP